MINLNLNLLKHGSNNVVIKVITQKVVNLYIIFERKTKHQKTS